VRVNEEDTERDNEGRRKTIHMNKQKNHWIEDGIKNEEPSENPFLTRYADQDGRIQVWKDLTKRTGKSTQGGLKRREKNSDCKI